MSDYDANHWWAEKFIEKYQNRDIYAYPELEHIQIKFSKYYKSQEKMVMFSFQDNKNPTIATPLYMTDYHNMFKLNFKDCFNIYFEIGKKYL